MEWGRFCETIGCIGEKLKKSQIPNLKRSSRSEAPNTNIQAPEKHQVSNKSHFSRTLYSRALSENAVRVLNETPHGSDRHPFDLEERTAQFGEGIIRFCKRIPRSPASDRLVSQLVGCGTSVGANYCEANEGVSKKDFRNVIGRCVKEAKERKFFLRMIASANPTLAEEARALFREAKELHLIFAAIFRK